MAEKTKIDIFSGFLGAGKTTLIKKLIQEAFKGEKIVLIENEFGEIGIDGGFMREAGIQVNELNSGCICCSLVGDFREALKKVVETYHPDRILYPMKRDPKDRGLDKWERITWDEATDLVVSKTEEKSEIMRSILKKAGPDTPAKAIAFSLPTSEVAGFGFFDS